MELLDFVMACRFLGGSGASSEIRRSKFNIERKEKAARHCEEENGDGQGFCQKGEFASEKHDAFSVNVVWTTAFASISDLGSKCYLTL
jgi:hypothetical protein